MRPSDTSRAMSHPLGAQVAVKVVVWKDQMSGKGARGMERSETASWGDRERGNPGFGERSTAGGIFDFLR